MSPKRQTGAWKFTIVIQVQKNSRSSHNGQLRGFSNAPKNQLSNMGEENIMLLESNLSQNFVIQTQYNPERVTEYFDAVGIQEWHRLMENPTKEVALHVHTHYLKKFVRAGDRVLEIGAGAGRFTQVLAQL